MSDINTTEITITTYTQFQQEIVKAARQFLSVMKENGWPVGNARVRDLPHVNIQIVDLPITVGEDDVAEQLAGKLIRWSDANDVPFIQFSY